MTSLVYTTSTTLSALREALSVFIPAWLPEKTKEKIEKQIRTAYVGYYELQLAAIGITKSIEISHLLGGNDIVIPFIVAEYRTLKQSLDTLRKNLEKLKFNETKDSVDTMLAAIKVDVGALLLSDLNVMQGTFLPTLDITACMTNYKR